MSQDFSAAERYDQSMVYSTDPITAPHPSYLGRHVEYVLTADFDIDSGPTVRYQYPSLIQGDQHLIAELMLPDQSHVRTEDWTVFFLYHQHGHTKLEYHIQNENDKTKASKLYVLNLVNTKFDKDVKRGAIVKAMCIVTPHPFFHVFKPLLLLALDEYFKTPTVHCLRKLYESINSIDLSRIPALNYFERQILSASDKPNIFSEKFEDVEDPLLSDARNHRRSDSATIMSPSSTAQSYDSASPTMRKGSVATVGTTDSHDNKPFYYIDLKSQGQRVITGNVTRDTHFYESKVNFNDMKIPIKVPIDVYPESVGDFSMINLVSTLLNITQPCDIIHPELTIYGASTPPLLILINGLLTQKRILFVGLNSPSGEVSDRVLAACSLASGGILRSFVTNAFPYTDLSKVDDLLSSPGYIAGVKNPAFGHHSSWWDILIDLEAGTLRISPNIGIPGPSLPAKQASTNDKNAAQQQQNLLASMNPEDVAFIADLRCMIRDHFAESSIRTRCRNYIKRFIRIATNYEEFKYNKTLLWPSRSDPRYNVVGGYGYTWVSDTQRAFDFNCYAPVIEGWRMSRSYRQYVAEQTRIWPTTPKKVFDYDYHLDKLRYQKVGYDESAYIFTTLAEHVTDRDETMRLLTASSVNNLFYIALGLFHKSPQVRVATARVISKIETHVAGQHFFDAMSQFQKVAYKRLLHEATRESHNRAIEGPPMKPEHKFTLVQ